MTHFSSRIHALPTIPILVVKLWPVFDHLFLVDFWSLFGQFVSILVKNSIFPLKTHFFDSFFDLKLSDFWVIFGSFLGFLGGYPSPSISAPLVVKKCPKLYIYNIRGGHPWSHLSPVFIVKPLGPHQIDPLKIINGRTRMFQKATLCNLPDMNKNGVRISPQN